MKINLFILKIYKLVKPFVFPHMQDLSSRYRSYDALRDFFCLHQINGNATNALTLLATEITLYDKDVKIKVGWKNFFSFLSLYLKWCLVSLMSKHHIIHASKTSSMQKKNEPPQMSNGYNLGPLKSSTSEDSSSWAIFDQTIITIGYQLKGTEKRIYLGHIGKL